MDPNVKYLLSLRAVRERARVVWQAAEAGELSHFDLHRDKLGDVADFVISVIQVPTHYCPKPERGIDELTIDSVTLGLTSTTPSRPTAVGSTSTSAMCRVFRT